jgi:hypothetical protein
MQSGTTGINTIRIYSPKKLRRPWSWRRVYQKWLPELADIQLIWFMNPEIKPPLNNNFIIAK